MKRSGMFRERNEWPSTAGGLPAEERSGYMELCAVRSAGTSHRVRSRILEYALPVPMSVRVQPAAVWVKVHFPGGVYRSVQVIW
jgi:hypothetical protein